MAMIVRRTIVKRNALNKRHKKRKDPLDVSSRKIAQLCKDNKRLVIFIIQRYSGKGVSNEDLLYEGNKGLYEAARKFNPSKGFKFSTYAVPWIKKYMLEVIKKQSRYVSLDNSCDDDQEDKQFEENVKQDIKKPIPDFMEREQFEEAFVQLSSLERGILSFKLGLDNQEGKHTLIETAQHFEITVGKVRQIIKRVQQKIRAPNIALEKALTRGRKRYGSSESKYKKKLLKKRLMGPAPFSIGPGPYEPNKPSLVIKITRPLNRKLWSNGWPSVRELQDILWAGRRK